MNIAVVDISRKVPLYDYALCQSLYDNKSPDDTIWYVSPKGIKEPQKWEHNLKSLLPLFLKSKQNVVRRVLKGLEVFYNYYELRRFINKKAIDILHLEWLPMLEVSEYEIQVLKSIKKHKNIKIVLTVHNLYPHNYSEEEKILYKRRFEKACDYIAFLHKGRLVLCEEKDRLYEQYRVIHCTEQQLTAIDKAAVIGKKVGSFGAEAIVLKESVPEGIQGYPIDIEKLFIFMVKEGG